MKVYLSSEIHTGQAHQEAEVLPSLDGVLLQGDIEALEDAINEDKMAQ